MTTSPLPPSGSSLSVQPASDPDTAYILRATKGDALAWEYLVDRHLPRLHAMATRMTGSAAEAEDIAQETFERAWKTLSSWRPGQALYGTWLMRVAINLCRDRLRRIRPLPLSEAAETASSEPNAEQCLQASIVSVRVRAALDALPERQREALILTYYQHLPNVAAAEIMGISVDALESLLARGRRQLRRNLASEAGDLLGDLS